MSQPFSIGSRWRADAIASRTTGDGSECASSASFATTDSDALPVLERQPDGPTPDVRVGLAEERQAAAVVQSSNRVKRPNCPQPHGTLASPVTVAESVEATWPAIFPPAARSCSTRRAWRTHHSFFAVWA